MIQNLNAIFLLLALLAEVIGTIGGFGSSVFFVPIANVYFDYHSVLGLTALFHVSSNISKILLFKKGIDKKILMNIGVPSVIFVIVGGVLSKYLDTLKLEVALGVFLIVLSLVFLLRSDLYVKPDRKSSILGGTLSGFAAGLLGTGGAIRGVTLAAFNLEKSMFIATSAAIDFAIDFTRTFVYYFNGYIHYHDLKYVPFLFIIGILGTYIGKKLLTKMPQEKFRMISLLLVLAVGMFTLVKLLLG